MGLRFSFVEFDDNKAVLLREAASSTKRYAVRSRSARVCSVDADLALEKKVTKRCRRRETSSEWDRILCLKALTTRS